MNSTVVRAAARGIILAKNANLLDENGEGINLTKDWANQLLVRMGYVKRKATTKAKIHSIILNLSIMQYHQHHSRRFRLCRCLQMSVSQSETSIIKDSDCEFRIILQGAVVFCPPCH